MGLPFLSRTGGDPLLRQERDEDETRWNGAPSYHPRMIRRTPSIGLSTKKKIKRGIEGNWFKGELRMDESAHDGSVGMFVVGVPSPKRGTNRQGWKKIRWLILLFIIMIWFNYEENKIKMIGAALRNGDRISVEKLFRVSRAFQEPLFSPSFLPFLVNFFPFYLCDIPQFFAIE